VVGLIGPNGAGKTTLFECLAGVLPSDRGTIAIDGEVIAGGRQASRLFYVPDGIAPWPAQTLRWALDFTTGFFGGFAPHQQVIERFELTPLLDVPIGRLSKGQRKRAVLAIGLLTPQPLLLADEPFDGLDLRQTREIGKALRVYVSEGRTLFLSIHQITDAARVCDRFVLLSGGRVRGQGTLDELAGAAAERGAMPRSSSLEDVFLALT
jgi:ABC-2 type transport system ATP-binding protein